MADHETILTALADGLTVGKAARALGVTETEVRAALRETADNVRNGEHLRNLGARGHSPASSRPEIFSTKTTATAELP